MTFPIRKSHIERYCQIISFLEEHLDNKSDSSEPQSEASTYSCVYCYSMKYPYVQVSSWADTWNKEIMDSYNNKTYYDSHQYIIALTIAIYSPLI